MRKKIFCALFSIFIFTQSTTLSTSSENQKSSIFSGKILNRFFFSPKKIVFSAVISAATFLGLSFIYAIYKLYRDPDAFYARLLFDALRDDNLSRTLDLWPVLNLDYADYIWERNQTILFWACHNNYTGFVRALIPYCSQRVINAREYDRGTPLCRAVINNNFEIVEALIEYGSNIEADALHEAQKTDVDRTLILNYLNEVIRNDPERFLRQFSIATSRQYKDECQARESLFNACRNDHRCYIKDLEWIVSPRVVNFISDYNLNETALFWTCKNNNADAAKAIIPHCSLKVINLCTKNEEGTPLHQAVINNNLEIVEALVEHGSSIEEEVLQEARKKDVDRSAISNYLNRIVREEPDRLIKRNKIFKK